MASPSPLPYPAGFRDRVPAATRRCQTENFKSCTALAKRQGEFPWHGGRGEEWGQPGSTSRDVQYSRELLQGCALPRSTELALGRGVLPNGTDPANTPAINKEPGISPPVSQCEGKGLACTCLPGSSLAPARTVLGISCLRPRQEDCKRPCYHEAVGRTHVCTHLVGEPRGLSVQLMAQPTHACLLQCG